MASLGSLLGSYLGGVSLSVQTVEQITLNRIRVSFADGDPIAFNRNAGDDALNVANYTIVADAPSPLVQWVTSFSDSEIDIWLDRQLVAGEEVQVSIANIGDSGGGVMPAFSGTFVAFGAEPAFAQREASNGYGRVDIANPQTVRDANGGPLGTYSITEGGDLGNDTGRTNLRKRVFRRITTRPGGFFHLPDYGVRQRDKALMTPTSLRELQIDLEAQLRREPDVVGVRVRVSEMAPGVVRLKVRVQDNLGAFDVEGTLDLNGGDGA